MDPIWTLILFSRESAFLYIVCVHKPDEGLAMLARQPAPERALRRL